MSVRFSALSLVRRALRVLGVLTFAALPALAQERFPAIPEAQLEDLLRNARCAPDLTTIALTAARTDTWRGFAIRLCTPDYQPAGAVVGWYEQTGSNRVVVTRPDGQPIPMMPQAWIDGHQQAQFTVFGARFDGRNAACGFARSNWRTEPWAATFCNWVDAQGNPLR